MNPLEYHPSVPGEIDAAYHWYEARRVGGGDSFLEALRLVLADIQASPGRFSFAHDDIRAAPIGRYPYAVYHRELSDRIRILAVLHTARDPAAWQSRN